MGRKRGTYGSYGRRRRRRRQSGMLFGIVVVVLLAVLFGVLAYQISKNSKEDFPGIFTPTETPTPSPSPSPSPTPTVTPTPTEVPISPETGLPCTPTPTPKPAWNENYLVGFEDTREKVNVIGAYVGLNLTAPGRLDYWLNLADTTELNALVIDVKADTGRITYQMDADWLQEMGICLSQYSDMPGLLKTLKEHGIYTVARVVCFKDNFIGDIHPEYMLHNKDGSMYTDNKGDTWMNPYSEDAWKYIIDIAEQAVKDGFDEICFDYVRVATNGMSNVDFGDVPEGMTLEDAITGFSKYACNRLKPTGAFVSASVYGAIIRSSVDAELVGQNYVEMARYFDYMCPMVYPSHYANSYAGIDVPDAKPYQLILSELQASVKKLSALAEEQDTYAEVRPWLQAFTATWVKGHITYNGATIRKQIDATYDAGYKSWFLWNASGSYPDGSFTKN